MNRKEFLLILTSAGVGFSSTIFLEDHLNLKGFCSLMPLVWAEAEDRRSAFLVPFVFYLTVSRGIVPGAYVFFRDGSIVRAMTLWILSASALAIPYWLLHVREIKNKTRRALGTLLAITASMPPPLGLIGWTNPLTATGLFFSGLGWYGLASMLILYVGAALFSTLRRSLIILVLIAVPFFNIPATPEKITTGNVTIQSVDTYFGRMASGSADFDIQYERERSVFHYLRENERNGQFIGSDIVILPETVIGRMYPTTMKRWERFFAPAAEKDVVFIAGGEVPTHHGAKYDNVMTSFEKEGKRQIIKQRFPVPFSMYRPFTVSGANAYISSLGELSIIEIHGKKLGFLVCYEQFLTWPLLTLMSQKPDVIIASANLWWCGNTSLPEIRASAISLWSRLFNVPLISATNI